MKEIENELKKKIKKLENHKKNLNKLKLQKQKINSKMREDSEKNIEHERAAIKEFLTEIIELNHRLADEINNTGAEIVNQIDEYNHLTEQMSDVEQFFYTQVILPASQLKILIEKRKFLEREYKRIKKELKQMMFSDRSLLEEEVKNILKEAEVDFIYKEADKSKTEENRSYQSFEEFNDIIDEKTKKEITKEFKRIVLPKIHPDTSETDEDDFNRIMDTYRKKDFPLMEAYIVKYRGKIEPDRDNPELFIDLYSSYYKIYNRLLDKLNKRIKRAKEEITQKEFENPELIEREINDQHNEIRKKIYEEMKKISELKKRFEFLLE